MLTEREYLLISVMEECDEVSHRISKALRFGLDEIQEGQELTNFERIQGEVADLLAVLGMAGIKADVGKALANIEAKQKKICKYMGYARLRGTLEPFQTKDGAPLAGGVFDV